MSTIYPTGNFLTGENSNTATTGNNREVSESTQLQIDPFPYDLYSPHLPSPS